MGDELYPIAVLIEELKNENTQIRLNSIKRLSTIGLALGEERTRTELMPFLNGEPLMDDEEVLLAIAEELGRFVPLVGGPAYAYSILPPLEALAATEETVVREQAVESLNAIAKQMTVPQIEEHVVPAVVRLATDIGWASHVSACGLVGVVIHADGISQGSATKMKELFEKMCGDEMPMVRKAAAANIGDLAAGSSQEMVKKDLLPLFNKLITDEQDNVRPVAVEAAVQFARVLGAEDTASSLIPPLHQASKDRSWRVRHVVAEKFVDLQTVCGLELARTELATMLVRLIKDQEKEVRMEAAAQLPHVCEGMPAADRVTVFSHSVMPHIEPLSRDASQHVRIKLAAVLVEVAAIIGKEQTLESLVPLFIQLLRDENAETRLSVVSGLGKLNDVVGTDVVIEHILPELQHLAEDIQWRVRLAMSEQFPALGKALGEESFDSYLTELLMNWLSDSVFAIRQSACKVLSELLGTFGEAWAKKTVVPRVRTMAEEGPERTYIARLTSLMLIQHCSATMDKDALNKMLLPSVIKLCKDPVPNVRFNASKTLEAIASRVDKGAAVKEIRPQLEAMLNDTDSDVQYFAKSALAAY
eukprot:m.171747 g.171747  ORF g.171747 m.171747 type:complete len:588 (-) comp13414_c0_seq1:213-1976(-)